MTYGDWKHQREIARAWIAFGVVVGLVIGFGIGLAIGFAS